MKTIVKRIQKVVRSGTSKAGNPYSIDKTILVVDVPYSNLDGFGSKEKEYDFGDSTNFNRFESIRGKLPIEIDIELGTVLDSYGNPDTAVVDVKLPNIQKT